MKTRSLPINAAFAAVLLLAGTVGALAERADRETTRSGYSYLRASTGSVTVVSKWNGRVEARRNMPISAGDEMAVSEGGRAEVALADGNVLHLGGGTTAAFESLHSQQGEDDEFSGIRLRGGSVVLSAIGVNDNQIPRIDTEDATIYLSAGSRARVNVDSRRGTAVIARAGSVEVRTPEGSYKLKPGQYLLVRSEEEPSVERGAFSRDRFDIWSAERLESLGATRSVSSRYVDEEYADDVVALDGYGDWNYSNTYSNYVWSPRVNAGWSPYSDGSWYYTTAGLTWWSNDPWGWYPHHYGNWFFESSWNRWCWSPANVYSPAWVYWGYTPSYVGWCPVGYYTGYSPWWGSYYRHIGWDRTNVYVPIHGNFNTRQVDFRGWNFTGAGRFGSGSARAEVIRGDRIGDRLGGQVAISSRPIVLSGRGGGDAREAMRNYIREAPRVIERTASADSGRLAPILGRERTLPTATVEALRDRAVVAERGRLAGPAAAEMAPRGVRVDRGRALGEPIPGRAVLGTERGSTGGFEGRRDPIARGRLEESAPARSAPEAPPARGRLSDDRAPATRFPDRTDRSPARGEQDWRGRGRSVDGEAPRVNPAPVAPAAPVNPGADRFDRRRSDARDVERPRPEGSPSDWRSRRMQAPAPESPGPRREEARPQDWRSRSEVPPARRVIEGSVPNRREPEGFRERGPMPREERPAYRPEARSERSAPSYPQPQAPRGESRPAPPPRGEPQAAPPPRAESHQAPAPPPAKAPERGRKD